jgi:nucleoside-diphosphate-sugar epimerase
VPNNTTFANNATATFNVFAAARAAGIRRVVWASSETVLGLPFDSPPPYVPVDEDYAPRPESTYSLVKTLEEEMARHFCRWDPELTMVGLRFSNVMEPQDYAAFPAFDADPLARKWNLWGYIDARDGAQAVRRALDYDQPGAEVFIIANADTVMSRSSDDLVAEVFPGVEVRRELGDHETLLSIEKARRLLGYAPEHSWRDSLA